MLRATTPKPKRCKVCGGFFTPLRPLMVVCGLECSVQYADKAIAKSKAKLAAEDRKQTQARREALRTRGEWAELAQKAFNAWIRKRDELEGCISCGTHNGKMNAGHFKSVGAKPELRFEPLNVHKQCERCNTSLHGNLLEYRANLVAKRGVELVEWLEGPHEAKHYKVDDLKELAAEYRRKLRHLEKA